MPFYYATHRVTEFITHNTYWSINSTIIKRGNKNDAKKIKLHEQSLRERQETASAIMTNKGKLWKDKLWIQHYYMNSYSKAIEILSNDSYPAGMYYSLQYGEPYRDDDPNLMPDEMENERWDDRADLLMYLKAQKISRKNSKECVLDNPDLQRCIAEYL